MNKNGRKCKFCGSVLHQLTDQQRGARGAHPDARSIDALRPVAGFTGLPETAGENTISTTLTTSPP